MFTQSVPKAYLRLLEDPAIRKGGKLFVVVILSAVLWLPVFHGLAGEAITVQVLPGDGSDISVGADGTAWCIRYDPSDKDRDLYRWMASEWTQASGNGNRVAIDPQGNPWVLSGDGDVKHWENGSWSDKPGRGTDIAVGANGDVWMVGWYTDIFDTDTHPNNREVFHWTGSDWEEIDGDAVRIAVAPDGTPWVINHEGVLHQRKGGDWVEVDGRVLDIGIGADGSIWASFGDDWTEDGQLAKLEGGNWLIQGSAAAAVTVDPSGMPWFANGNGQLFRGTVSNELRLSMPIVYDGKVQFTFPTVSGANYVVQVWRDLDLPYTELQRVTGDGSTVTVTDTPPPGVAKSFYGVSRQ